MLNNIRSHKYVLFIVRFIICYILVSNVLVNTFYHLKADEKVEKVIVRTPTQQEIVITSDDVIEKVNRQFHMQVLLSLGLGVLKQDHNDSFRVIFYNGKNKEMKGFNYNPKNKKIYPGELNLPQNTEMIMDELIAYVHR